MRKLERRHSLSYRENQRKRLRLKDVARPLIVRTVAVPLGFLGAQGQPFGLREGTTEAQCFFRLGG